MGLFGKKEDFDLNALKTKALNKQELTRQELKYFIKEVGNTPSAYASDVNNTHSKPIAETDRERRFKAYSPTEKMSGIIHFDDFNKILKFANGISFKPNKFIAYEDIADFQIIEDNNQVIKSGLGTAIGGGVLFGPAGAIAGAVIGKGRKGKEFIEKLQIVLKEKNGQSNTVSFISTKTKTKSLTYKALEPEFRKAVLKIEAIVKENAGIESTSQQTTPTSNVDEIRNYKSLLDDGIITQEEFDAKKKELLGL